ncbi:MAG: DnaJ domain-containing protein [bacterium]|jgi:curved DNA-binding protein CbpA|nr:DnaJ domain-containing protein [bacterium]
MEPDPYRVLQVDPQAEPEVVDAAFRGLARKYHPDVNPAPEAAEQMERIVAAYEVLRDPDRRAAYDRSLKVRRRPPSAKARAGAAADEGISVSLLGGLIGLDVKRRRRST